MHKRKLLICLFVIVVIQIFHVSAQTYHKDETKIDDYKIEILFNEMQVQEQNLVFYEAVEISIRIDETIDLNESYLMLNDEIVAWNIDEEGWMKFTIYDPGIYEFSYHIQDGKGGIHEKQYRIRREYTSAYEVHFNDEIVDDQTILPFYNTSIEVTIQFDLVEYKDMMIKDKDEEIDVEWTHEGYHHKAQFMLDDYEHALSLYINGEEQDIKIQEKQFVIDKVKPITYITYDDSHAYHDHDISMHVKIQDKYLDEEKCFIELNSSGKNEKIFFQRLDNSHMINNLNLVKDGDYKINVHVYDKAGNESIYHMNGIAQDHIDPISIILDKTSPEIRIHYDDQQTEKYINHERIAYITILDRNIDGEAIQIQLYHDHNVIANAMNYEKIKEGFVISVPILEDGIYELNVIAQDRAKNTVEHISEAFVIDKTAPVLSIRGVSQNAYLNTDVDIALKVEDINIETYEITVSCNGKAIELTDIKMLHHDQLDEIITLKDDQTKTSTQYTIQLQAIDKAGNKSVGTPMHFTIDKSPPTIEGKLNQFLIKDSISYAFSKPVQLLLQGDDDTLCQQDITIMKNGEPYIDEVEYPQQNQSTFRYEFIPQENRDDLYELFYTLKDKAGNRTVKTIELHMDTYLPVIEIENDIFLGKASNKSWIPKLKHEHEEFEVIQSELIKNNELVDYVWGKQIEDEGDYELQVFVMDSAGNTATMDKKFTFCIDRSPPVIQFMDVDTNELYNSYFETQQAHIRIYLLAMDKDDHFDTIKVNQQVTTIDEVSYDTAQRPYVDLKFHEASLYNIEVSAIDEAGNKSMRSLNFRLASQTYFDYRDMFVSAICILSLCIIMNGCRRKLVKKSCS